MKFWETCITDLGMLTIVCDEEALLCIDFGEVDYPDAKRKRTKMIEETESQLIEFLSGKRTRFDLNLRPEGTAFQKKVWNALLAIPYGETKSYRDIAVQIENPKACRAVGMANNRNPIPIIIPCHRVIGAGGGLVGYGGGLDIKVKLLKLECPEASYKNY